MGEIRALFAAEVSCTLTYFECSSYPESTHCVWVQLLLRSETQGQRELQEKQVQRVKQGIPVQLETQELQEKQVKLGLQGKQEIQVLPET